MLYYPNKHNLNIDLSHLNYPEEYKDQVDFLTHALEAVITYADGLEKQIRKEHWEKKALIHIMNDFISDLVVRKSVIDSCNRIYKTNEIRGEVYQEFIEYFNNKFEEHLKKYG